ncbi:MAG: PHP domain-containing protein [Oscillospiraceae bacterium]
MSVSCDLHLHSCLSPCADNDMTPFDLVGMSAVNGLELVALTDHNSARNCPAAAAAAAEYGIGFIPGMEVTTAEDIHVVCLFPSLDAALAFDRVIYDGLPDIRNKPEIFGEQLLFSPEGHVTGQEPRLLITGCALSILELPARIRDYGGLCYPAHVDREGNGLLATLGGWPPELEMQAAEIHAVLPPGLPDGIKILRGSDAHRLIDLPSEGCALPLTSPDFDGLRRWIAGD